MRALFLHLSGFVGLVVFLNQLSNAAALERTLWTASATGLGVYLVLVLAYVAVHRILQPGSSAETASAPEPPELTPKSQG